MMIYTKMQIIGELTLDRPNKLLYN
jgi:hypothetical protein